MGWWALGLALFSFISVTTGVFSLKTDLVQKTIQDHLNQQLPGELTWEAFQFSLLKGTFEIEGFSLKDPKGVELTSFRRLVLDLSWLALLSKELRVEALQLEAPQVFLEADSSGNLNIMSAFPKRDTTLAEAPKDSTPLDSTINFVLNNLTISQGDIQFVQLKDSTIYTINGFHLESNGDFLKKLASLNFSLDSGTVRSLNTEINKFSIQEFSLSTKLNQQTLSPLSIAVRTTDSHIKLEGSVAQLLDSPQLDLIFDTDIDLQEVSRLELTPPMSGRIKSNLLAKGEVDNPTAQFHFDYSGGQILNWDIKKVAFDFNLQQYHVTLDSLWLDLGHSGNLFIKGKSNLEKVFPNGILDSVVQLENLTYDFALNAHQINLESLAPDTTGLSGKINGNINAKGKGIHPDNMAANANAHIKATSLTFNPQAKPLQLTFDANAHLSKGNIVVDNLHLSAGTLKLDGEANYHIDTKKISTTLALKAPDLETNLNALGIDSLYGSVDLNAEISGTTEAPTGKINLQGKDLMYKSIRIGLLNLKTSLNKTGIVQSNLSLTNGKSKLELLATAHILKGLTPLPVESMTYDLKVEESAIYIEDFVDSLVGKISLNSNINGIGLRPKGNFDVKGFNLDIGLQSIPALNLHTQLNGDTIVLKPFKISLTPEEFIELKAQILLQNKTYDMQIYSNGISLTSIQALKLPDSTGATITLDFTGTGSFENPELSGALSITELVVQNRPLENLVLNLNVANQLAQVHLDHDFGLKGSYHLKSGDFNSTIDFRNTNLLPYLQFTGQKELSGVLTGTIKAEGNTGKIENIKASIKLPSLNLLYNETPLIKSKNFDIRYLNETIEVQDLKLQLLEKGHLSLSGSGKPEGPYKFSINGEIPLKVARPFAPDLEDVDGNIFIVGSLGGHAKEPDIDMAVTLDNISLTIPTLMQKLHNLNGKITGTNNAVHLEKLTGNIDDGTFSISGKAGLKEFTPENFTLLLSANTLPLRIPDVMDIQLDADLAASGTQKKSSITGSLTLLKGLYYQDVNLNLLKGLGKEKRQEAPPSTEEAPEFLRNTSLDINVKYREPFQVENNMALLSITPELSVNGTAANPALTGKSTIESGKIVFQKKEFVVKKGVIDFLNPYKIEPTLDIESQVEIREGTWIITLILQGPPENLVFKLTSDPPLEDEDILSLLVTGKTTGELRQGEGSGGLSTQQMLRKALADIVQDQLKDKTGLDILNIEGAGEKEGVKVTLGKQLSRRLLTKYAVESDDGEIVQKAIAEYKFLENLLMSGFQDTKGVYGGEVQVILEFK